MKMLKTIIVVAVVFGFVASAHAIKVHQRLFLMTNTIEAAQSLGLIETNLTDLTIVSDGTVAIDTNGVMYVNHTGVWQRVSGQGGTITTVTGNDGISAVEVAGTVTLDVDPGNGIIIDVSQNVAVGDGAGLVVNTDDVEVGQGDGIQVNPNDVAVDDTVVRTFGDQNITGIKTFSDIKVTNLYAINEHVVNITVSNMALIATNLSVQGAINMNGNVITNLAESTEGTAAVTYNQLTNATQGGSTDLIAATNQLSNDLTVYIDGATNQTLIDATTYIDGATNQTLIDARTYTDSATNALMIEAEDLFVNEAGDNMTGILGMGGNKITNVAAATDGMDAVNYTQLTNATQGAEGDIIAATNQLSNDLTVYIDGATNQTLIDASTYTDSATNALMIEAEDLFVNEAGDNMTGILGMGANQITNLAPGTDGLDAVNFNQLTNAIEQDSITEIIGGDAITATKTGSSVEIDVNAGTGLEIDTDTVRIAATAAGDGLTGGGGVALAVDDTVVRTFGDQQITGIKTFSDIKVTNLYAINEHVVNITVSNMALVATNLSVQGAINMNGNVITNLAESTEGTAAVTYNQLTNATQGGSADLIAATNQLSNDLTVYIDGATNQTLIDATTYVDGATNQTLIDARTYTDSATNALMIEAEDLFVNEAGDNMTGILGMGGNKITNVAAATDGMDAVNYTQLTNATQSAEGDIIAATNQLSNDLTIYIDGATNAVLNTANNYTDSATNAVLITANNYTDSATNALMIEAEDLFVNEAGDDMTGILGMGGNRITNVADAVDAQDAITKAQLDAATNNLAGDVTLQKAYENGNTITTSVGEGDVTVAGTQGLTVSADAGIYVTGTAGIFVQESVEVDGLTAMDGGATLEGGALQVNDNQNIQMNNDGGTSGQINMDGPTGDDSIRVNGSGRIEIYSNGSLALEFE